MNATSDNINNEPDRMAMIQRQVSDLARQLEWIKAVDRKIPIIIGLATAMLVVTGALAPGPKSLTWGTSLLIAIGSLPQIGTLCWCAAATYPHMDGPVASLIYFGSICKMTRGSTLKLWHLVRMRSTCRTCTLNATETRRLPRPSIGGFNVPCCRCSSRSRCG